jgi:hypothetical protein
MNHRAENGGLPSPARGAALAINFYHRVALDTCTVTSDIDHTNLGCACDTDRLDK